MPNCKTIEILGNEVGESREQIRRYIRLTTLVPKLLDLVDEGKIKMRPCGRAFLFGRGQSTGGG